MNNRLSLDYGTNHESGTELRHEAAGVKLFRKMARLGGATLVSARMLGYDQSVSGGESRSRESGDEPVARAEHAGRDRLARAGQRRSL